jgi:hypothetical protein
MEKEYLRDNYKEFRECRTERDFIEIADNLNTSREYYYRMSDGCGTFDVNDVFDLIVDNGSWCELNGFIKVELHNVYGNVVAFEIPIDICFEDWDEEVKCFNSESYVISDVAEW